jgi:hypothetical protein
MALHDAYARVTPYELSFPDLEWGRTRFAEIKEEAEGRGVDPDESGRFVMLASVGRLLRELRPEDEAVERIHSHGLLLYHAFHFWESGELLLLVDIRAARRAVDAHAGGCSGELPAKAGYAQLPQHLFWTGAEDGAGPESVDGFFWTSALGGAELHILLIAGIHVGRPGFSVVPVAPGPVTELFEWCERPGRDDGRDFASEMPGSELEGLYQVTTSGEALKLAARLWLLPGLVTSPGHGRVDSTFPAPSRLPYSRITVRG